jgi:hypothetical protein
VLLLGFRVDVDHPLPAFDIGCECGTGRLVCRERSADGFALELDERVELRRRQGFLPRWQLRQATCFVGHRGPSVTVWRRRDATELGNRW